MESQTKRLYLTEEEPEIFSCVLEYMYKGDYYPRLVLDKRRDTWILEPQSEESRSSANSTVFHHRTEGDLLKDTVVYCAAERYGLDELKRLSLRKQGLREFFFSLRCVSASS
jgi:hypothetical protein